MNALVKFGRYLREAREARGLTLRDLARRARVAESSVCDIEKGRRRPSLPAARRLAGALNLDVHEVFARAGIVTPAGIAYLRRTPALLRKINRDVHLQKVAA